MRGEFSFTVPTLVLVVILLAAVMVIWWYGISQPASKWINRKLEKRIESWAEKEKDKIRAARLDNDAD